MTEEQVNYQRSLKQGNRNHAALFFDLDGGAADLYNMVMAEVEPPLLKAVMHTPDKIKAGPPKLSASSQLQKKLKQYDLL